MQFVCVLQGGRRGSAGYEDLEGKNGTIPKGITTCQNDKCHMLNKGATLVGYTLARTLTRTQLSVLKGMTGLIEEKCKLYSGKE